MIRMLIQLEPVQYDRLKGLAARRSISVAQLIRDGVDLILGEEQASGDWDRFLAAAGSCRSNDGPIDVSARHDAYLQDALA